MKKLVKTMVEGVEKEIEIEVPDEPESKMNAKLPDGLIAARMKLVLSEKMTEEQVSHLNSLKDAEEMLDYFGLTKKNEAPTPEPKKGSVGNIKMLPKDNPDPRRNTKPSDHPPMVPYSAEELVDPLQTDDSRLNRYQDDENVRIIRHYSDEYLEGKLI